jgi:hypothetical protein
MSMSRKQIWLAVIVLPPALLLVFIMGLFAYMDATKTPLPPRPASRHYSYRSATTGSIRVARLAGR